MAQRVRYFPKSRIFIMPGLSELALGDFNFIVVSALQVMLIRLIS